MASEQKWEYKVLPWNSWDWVLLERILNDLGDSGWEVVATMADTILLKRPHACEERDDTGFRQRRTTDGPEQ